MFKTTYIRVILTVITLFFIGLVSGCGSSDVKKKATGEESHVYQIRDIPSSMRLKDRLSIMTMNAENLFDTEHDPGKLDFVYMPKAVKDANPQIQSICQEMGFNKKACLENDWNEQLLSKKIDRLSQAIVKNGAPDIIIFQEVENRKILNRLKDNINTLLSRDNSSANYLEAVLLEGPDRRGIDVAIMSKLPLAEQPKYHFLDWKKYDKPRDSRGILEATFKMPGIEGEKLVVFALHFPSQFLATKFRAISLEYLEKLMSRKEDQLEKEGQSPLVIAGGDSNIIEKEYHLWQDYMSDFIISKDLITPKDETRSKAKGTHAYKGEWSYLDVLIFTDEMSMSEEPDERASWVIDDESARIANEWPTQYKTNSKGEREPRRFKYPDYDGVADHFPFIVEIKKR